MLLFDEPLPAASLFLVLFPVIAMKNFRKYQQKTSSKSEILSLFSLVFAARHEGKSLITRDSTSSGFS